MFRIAAGEELGFNQTNVKLNGCSIETRIYVEDPSRNFLPSTGRLIKYQGPEESDHVRVDTGVREGDEISIYYNAYSIPAQPTLYATGTHYPEDDFGTINPRIPPLLNLSIPFFMNNAAAFRTPFDSSS